MMSEPLHLLPPQPNYQELLKTPQAQVPCLQVQNLHRQP
jgi:hypothetical protein